jgi:hypothetical protein
MQGAAQAAKRATNAIANLEDPAARATAAAAAIQDYNILLREYGESDDVIIGDPLDCFDDL